MIHKNEFMLNNNLTIRSLAKLIGISKSTLSYQMSQPINSWHYGLIAKIAKVVNTTPQKVVNELMYGGWHLNINDSKHTIQGVRIKNSMRYLKAKDVVINEYFEGWQPNSKDIKELNHNYDHPDKITRNALKEYIKGAKKEGVYLGK